MNLTMRRKDEIDAMIEDRVQEGICRFQLLVDVSMIKFMNDINESGNREVRSEKAMLYLNS